MVCVSTDSSAANSVRKIRETVVFSRAAARPQKEWKGRVRLNHKRRANDLTREVAPAMAAAWITDSSANKNTQFADEL